MPTELYNNVLITGGGGMLAHAIRGALSARGIKANVLSHSTLDISKVNEVTKAFDRLLPSVVLNCAAYTKVDLCETDGRQAAWDANVAGPGYLAGCAKQSGALLVHFSTDFVFDGKSARPYMTSDKPNPSSEYGLSKLGGEEMVRRMAGNYLLIRTAWLYGPGGPNFVQTMLNAARAGKPLKVVNDQTGSPTFTHDLAEATLNLIDAGARGIFHVTNSGQTTWFDFTRAILEEFDLKADLSPVTSAEWKHTRPKSATRPAYSVLDCSDYERVTGRKLPHWRDALHRYRLALSSD